MTDELASLTGFLNRAARGDDAASERVWTAIYDELHRMAQREMRKEMPGQTLDTTGLVHEAFFKFAERDGMEWESRRHFFATACRAMRQILVDRARYRNAQKRAAGQPAETLDSGVAAADQSRDLVAVDEALTVLGEHHERLARVVDCHFFGGLTFKETGDVLGTSERTAERDWRRAKAYLRLILEGDD